MNYNQLKKIVTHLGLVFLLSWIFVGTIKAQDRNLRLVFGSGYYMDTVTIVRDYGRGERDTIVNNVIISSNFISSSAKEFDFEYSKSKAKVNGFVAVLIFINGERLGDFRFRLLKRNAAIEINLYRSTSVRYAMFNEEYQKYLSDDELKYLDNKYLPKALWFRLAQNGKFKY